MSRPPGDPHHLFTRFGPPEATFVASRRDAVAGVLLGGMVAAFGFLVAALGTGFDATNRACALVLGLGGVCLGWWFWRVRDWRLLVCPGGLIQVRAGRVEAVGWGKVREVVETRYGADGSDIPPARVDVVGPRGRVRVNPIAHPARGRVLRAVLDAARRHNVPVRVEWDDSG